MYDLAEGLVKIAKELVAAGNAHHHKSGGNWYVDSNFVQFVSRVYPQSRLEHMGFGEFYLDTPDGRLEFNRISGKKFDGQIGRSYLLEDNANGKVIKRAINLMERSGESEEV